MARRNTHTISASMFEKMQRDHERLVHEVHLLQQTVRALAAGMEPQSYVPAQVDGSGITAGSTTTPGSGTVTLYRPRADGTVVSFRAVEVRNWCGAIAADAYIGVIQDAHGRWWTANGRC